MVGEDRIVGIAMVAAAIGVVAAMAYHPADAHAGTLAAAVHSAMIVFLTIWAWGFYHVALRLDVRRPLVLLGVVAFAISLAAHVGAATINGFAVPALAAPGSPPVSHDLFRFAWYLNQALAILGFHMAGLAFVSWSTEMLRAGGRLLTGSIGLLCGLIPPVLLAAGVIELDVHGALLAYSLQALWTGWMGVQLIRGTHCDPAIQA